MEAKDVDSNGSDTAPTNGDVGDSAKPTGGTDDPQPVVKAAEPKKRPGIEHPKMVAKRFPKGVSGHPEGRPPGIPNINDQLIKAIGDFRGGTGPKGKPAKKRFLTLLLEMALKDKDFMRDLMSKVLVDATPPPSTDVNVSQQVINEHSYHQTILADARVRAAAADLEESIGSVLNDSSGRGA